MMDNKELDDILNDPIFNLSDEEKSLFAFPEVLHVKAKRGEAEYVAQRVECGDF